jgi:glycosyltransferase involved in cell wall biosynthesis
VRIALVSTPFVTVPPPRYGGTELIVAELAEGLVARGHDVTLFATQDSRSSATVRGLYPRAVWPPNGHTELDHASWAIEQILGDDEPYDLVHVHIPAALGFSRLVDVPFVYTVHHDRDERLAPLYARVARRVQLVAISERQRALAPELSSAEVIHHGVSPTLYRVGRGDGGYVAFLGRFARDKGVDTAIRAARAAGLPIRLVGKPHCSDRDYFEQRVLPLVDGVQATVIGELGGIAKSQFLGGAVALAFPIDWEEPFGLVMIEAMLCGTPVVALGRGSVPEVVDEGVTGFIVPDERAMAARLSELARGGFDRARCRARALERWTADRMVEDHLRVYAACLERARFSDGASVVGRAASPVT